MSQGTSAQIDKELGALIDACEKEPIHIPQSIQSFGVLVVLSQDCSEWVAHSENVATFFPHLADIDIFAARPAEALPAPLIADLDNANQSQQHTIWSIIDELSYFAWLQNGQWVIEVEAYCSDSHNWFDLELQKGLDRIKSCITHQSLIQALTTITQAYTGYDRVMLYRFDEDWHGEVIAESVRGELQSMLHHHFPASDIPPQARAMYHHNPVRMIPDSHDEPVPLLMRSKYAEPVNLSRGSLRAVSPLHMQYLRNLGVAASASIALFEDDKLWGILACHHSEPRVIQPHQRMLLLRLIEFAAERLWLIHSRQVEHYMRRLHDARAALAESSTVTSSPHDLVQEHAEYWLELLRSDGLSYLRGERLTSMGEVPSHREITAIVKWLEQNNGHQLFWHTNEIQEHMPDVLKPDSPFAGILAIPLKMEADTFSYLILFRKEKRLTRKWAGTPEKMQVETKSGTMLGPRKSFGLWEEEVRGKSLPWRSAQLYAARDIARDLLIVADAMQLSILNERLEKLASFDDLTGVLNRRRLEEQLSASLNTAIRYQRSFGVLLLDLDLFKNINDSYGHHVGDEVLIKVCEVINSNLRETDVFGRWGGEEFMIIAPETSYPDTVNLAERVCAAVANADWQELPAVTVSIGIAHYEDDNKWDAIFERADKALYRAKANGRNRCESKLRIRS